MAQGFSPQSSLARIAPGTRLNGIYEVEVMIASGGMGEVNKGRTIHTSDPVAIKILRPEFGENEAALGLFRGAGDDHGSTCERIHCKRLCIDRERSALRVNAVA